MLVVALASACASGSGDPSDDPTAAIGPELDGSTGESGDAEDDIDDDDGDADGDGGPGTSGDPGDATATTSDGNDDPPSASEGGDAPTHGDPAADVPQYQALFDEIEGWATGTTGGLAGTIFVVDTLADDGGPSSLRAGLEASEPLWIVFADGVNGTIDLTDPLTPGSDKTVDARGHAIHMRTSGGDPFSGIVIEGQTNIVLVNLRLDDELRNWDQDAEGADGIKIGNSDHIWIHRCTFAHWLDGAIDIKYDPAAPGDLPHHISVTWSRFSEVYQALNWTADLISFGHNHCDKIRRRCIQVIDGKGHSYNNVIAQWDNPAIQNVKGAAQLYSQRNMFVPGGEPGVNSRVDGGKIGLANNKAFGNVNFLGGSDALSDAFVQESEMLAQIDVCDAGDDACWDELRALIESTAGVQ